MSFDLVGYIFNPSLARDIRQANRSPIWLPAVSRKSMRSMNEKTRKWDVSRKATQAIQEFAATINRVLRGRISYYGKFYIAKLRNFMQAINLGIFKWARSKYLKVRVSELKGLRWPKSASRPVPRGLKVETPKFTH